jgi:hypothetical protein
MKAKARRTFPSDPQAEKLANHMAFCGGFCCASRRRQFSGPTLRELRAMADDPKP